MYLTRISTAQIQYQNVTDSIGGLPTEKGKDKDLFLMSTEDHKDANFSDAHTAKNRLYATFYMQSKVLGITDGK